MPLALFDRIRTPSGYTSTTDTMPHIAEDLDTDAPEFCGQEACQAMLVGSLTLAMPSLSDRGLVLPASGKSLVAIRDTLHTIKTPTWSSGEFSHRYGGYREEGEHPSNIRSVISPSIDGIITGVQGLDLDKFISEE